MKVEIDYAEIVCCTCALTFYVPERWDNKRWSDKKEFYCPAGHPQSYLGQSCAERLKAAEARIASLTSERDRLAKRIKKGK